MLKHFDSVENLKTLEVSLNRKNPKPFFVETGPAYKCPFVRVQNNKQRGSGFKNLSIWFCPCRGCWVNVKEDFSSHHFCLFMRGLLPCRRFLGHMINIFCDLWWQGTLRGDQQPGSWHGTRLAEFHLFDRRFSINPAAGSRQGHSLGSGLVRWGHTTEWGASCEMFVSEYYWQFSPLVSCCLQGGHKTRVFMTFTRTCLRLK